MFETSEVSSLPDSIPGEASSPMVSETLHTEMKAGITEKKPHGTFELKFLIDDELTLTIKDWARLHLGPDPHMDPEVGEGYRVNSLYLDTPEFDVFHRMPGHRKRKFRLRRYGRESLIYFEQKHKRQGLVRKKRVGVPETEVAWRLQSEPDHAWDGHWFRRRVDEDRLRPVSQVVYQRFVRVTSTPEGPLRLTIDNQLQASKFTDWKVPQGDLEGVPLLVGKQVLELKFRGAMPSMFRRLIDQHQLQLTSFSKYRRSVEECLSLKSIPDRLPQEPADA